MIDLKNSLFFLFVKLIIDFGSSFLVCRLQEAKASVSPLPSHIPGMKHQVKDMRDIKNILEQMNECVGKLLRAKAI